MHDSHLSLSPPLDFLLMLKTLPALLVECFLHEIGATSDLRAYKRRRLHLAPRPLPPSRKRRLSLPHADHHDDSITSSELPEINTQDGSSPSSHGSNSSSTSSWLPSRKQQKTCSQTQSGFFKLSKDVRRRIYGFLWAEKRVVHVVPMHRRLGSFVCEEGDEHDVRACWDREVIRADFVGEAIPGIRTYRHTGIGVLGMLQTCRRMYKETVDLLYADRAFSFRYLDGLLAFSMAILPHRFHAIQTLHIDGRFLDHGENYSYQLGLVSRLSLDKLTSSPPNSPSHGTGSLLNVPNLNSNRNRLSSSTTATTMSTANNNLNSPIRSPTTTSSIVTSSPPTTPSNLRPLPASSTPQIWPATCALLASMQGLKNLHVFLSHVCFEAELFAQYVRHGDEEFIFGPLRQIAEDKEKMGCGLDVFEVVVDWPAFSGRKGEEEEEMGFRLTRVGSY